MSLLWDKGGAPPDERVQRFLAGRDVADDRAIFLYDLAASRAHVEGLARIALLSADEARALTAGLDRLGEEFRAGRFVLDQRFEDGHSAIEAHLGEQLGELGRKVHAGRSRNDQVLVALRLLYKDALAELHRGSIAASRALLARARADERTPMPGYTHLQRAVPSTVGLWLSAFAESFAEGAELAAMTRRLIDRSPLGGAAGYGVNLPLDREGVARALGFGAVAQNPLAAQNGRGKVELLVLGALAQVLLDLRRLAWDLSLFTSEEHRFVRLPDRYTTGSSIMPNKRNPDVVELLRAAFATCAGAQAEVQSVLSLPSGYHRDLQATKAPALRAIAAGLEALGLVPDLVSALELDRARMRAAIDPAMHATDRAIELARAGVPFRDAYKRVASEPEALAGRTPEESVAQRVSPGACAALGLAELEQRIGEIERLI